MPRQASSNTRWWRASLTACRTALGRTNAALDAGGVGGRGRRRPGAAVRGALRLRTKRDGAACRRDTGEAAGPRRRQDGQSLCLGVCESRTGRPTGCRLRLLHRPRLEVPGGCARRMDMHVSCDDYRGYDIVFKLEGCVEKGCLAHARRRSMSWPKPTRAPWPCWRFSASRIPTAEDTHRHGSTTARCTSAATTSNDFFDATRDTAASSGGPKIST